ncbi:MAG: alkaline phosphatase family protein [Solirubrobacterales bacterium]
MARKLCLIVVDSLRMDMLERTIAAGEAPNFAALVERGELTADCVSSFPTVTPVCNAEIATGTGPGLAADGSPGHGIMGMNWYHRVEERYVEYGNSLEATRAFGLFRSLYDIVYNLNMSHLSGEVETLFERLGDAGVRSACTPFLVYRGRTRHDVGLEGVLRKVAVAANFRHATWGPDELFWGELYASRRVPCKPTLARPGTRDEYSGCVGRELLRDDAYDFLLFSLPDNDYYSHKEGPGGQPSSIALADAAFGEVVDEAGGIDAFCDSHAVILTADHAQSEVAAGYDLAGLLGAEWRVLQPNDLNPDAAELAVSPTARAGAVYVLAEGKRRLRAHADVRERIARSAEADVLCWLAGPDGRPLERAGVGTPGLDGVEAVVESGAGAVAGVGELRFRPGSGDADLHGGAWELDGELAVLGLERSEGSVRSATHPDALARLWSALTCAHAGDVLVSLAPGYETVDWGGMTHVGGGSHGALLAEDSLVPLLTVGTQGTAIAAREQWRIADTADLVLEQFGALVSS